jgi:hypothetical protein
MPSASWKEPTASKLLSQEAWLLRQRPAMTRTCAIGEEIGSLLILEIEETAHAIPARH